MRATSLFIWTITLQYIDYIPTVVNWDAVSVVYAQVVDSNLTIKVMQELMLCFSGCRGRSSSIKGVESLAVDLVSGT